MCHGQQAQTEKEKYRNYGESNKVLNALIEKKFQKFVKNKKRRKTKKELQQFQEMQFSDDKSKKSVSCLAESVESGEISSSSSEWKIGSDELFVTCLSDNSENNMNQFKITWIFLLILVYTPCLLDLVL